MDDTFSNSDENYPSNPSAEDLLLIKKMLGEFFAKKLVQQVDQAVEEKGISEADLESWLNDEK